MRASATDTATRARSFTKARADSQAKLPKAKREACRLWHEESVTHAPCRLPPRVRLVPVHAPESLEQEVGGLTSARNRCSNANAAVVQYVGVGEEGVLDQKGQATALRSENHRLRQLVRRRRVAWTYHAEFLRASRNGGISFALDLWMCF